MRRYDGLSRLAWAALSAGLCQLSGCLVRASDAFLASGRVTTAKIALSLATGLLWASDRADRAAFPKIRA